MDTRVKFGDLNIGDTFFDEVSGEYWWTIDEGIASIITGGDDGTDTFLPDEYVIVEVE